MSLSRSQTISVPPGIPALLRDLVHEKTGLFFEDTRLDTLIEKLRDRAVACGSRSFLDYYYVLKYDGDKTNEWLRVMDAFSVQETYFYREYAQIKALVETLIPSWFKKNTEPLRIWSAACASGEEPYSLAMAIKERGLDRYPIEIIASDASELALSRAQAATYRERSFRSFPPELREKYFSPVTEGWELRKQLLPAISFLRVNLASAQDLARIGEPQVVFCRNVFIYFSPAAIQRAVSAFAVRIPEGGHLFIGASESLLKLTADFDLQEIGDAFVYVRIATRSRRTMSSPIRVVVIDDSAFVRKVVREMLSRDPEIEVVGAARDGEEGIQLIAELNPQVVTCDLNMPRLDGVAFVKRQMALRPLPILVLSASPQDADEVIQALDAGAFDFLQKPTALATDTLLEIRGELCAKVRAAAQAPVSNLLRNQKLAREKFQPRALNADIVVIGISTGGPQALRHLLPQFPADFPVPIAVVLHMPIGYTALFSEKLDELCAITVSEAKEGEALTAAHVYVAQAGRHLIFHRDAAGTVRTRLVLHPLELIHRPAADVLFQSAADVFKDRVLAVVMTGMGDDGKQGSAWVKAQGGTVLTEAEKSCVIYGMPRSVVEAGLSDAAVPLDMMAQEILKRL